MLLDAIQSDLTLAQKAKDKQRVDTLRFLLGEIHNLEIFKYPPSQGGTLTEEDVRAVITKQVKRHQESIEMFERGNRGDLVEKERAELAIIQTYLPAQMGEEEVRLSLQKIVAENPGADFGTLMKLAMGELGARVDGGTVARLLKELK